MSFCELFSSLVKEVMLCTIFFFPPQIFPQWLVYLARKSLQVNTCNVLYGPSVLCLHHPYVSITYYSVLMLTTLNSFSFSYFYTAFCVTQLLETIVKESGEERGVRKDRGCKEFHSLWRYENWHLIFCALELIILGLMIWGPINSFSKA